MKIMFYILFFTFVGFCYGMQSNMGSYQIASKYAECGYSNELFDVIEEDGLDLNEPFGQVENTLMHAMASCEDTAAFEVMVKKAVDNYDANLFIENKKGEIPIQVAANKWNLFKMLDCLDEASRNDYLLAHYAHDRQLYAHHQNQALFYKINQDYVRGQITAMLDKQTNKTHNLSIRFCNDSIEKVASASKKYLLINLKRFLSLPSIDAQNALLAHELDHHFKNPYQIARTITNPQELKRFNWYCELDADFAALQKFPSGSIQLFKCMQQQPDLSQEASDTHPPFSTRLSIAQSLIKHYKIKM